MNPDIKKIRLKELKIFVASELFQKLRTIPISPLRADSYLQNPDALPDDVVLYLGFVNNELIAFRSIFAGVTQSEQKTVRFGWCSGNWVHPGFRRKGFSEMLLREAYCDWDKKLMFTNYAPESEKLYLKSGWFHPIFTFEGARAYLFPQTKKLVKTSKQNLLFRAVFSTIDAGIKILSVIRISCYPARKNSGVKFVESKTPDEECLQVFEKNKSKHIFRRGEHEYRWIFDYPWLSAQKNNRNTRYPFSSYAEVFYYKFVKVFIEEEFAGVFLFSVRDGHLKTLGFWIDEKSEREIILYLKRFCAKNNIELLTVYNRKIAGHLLKNKFPFLRVKSYGQKIYGTFEIGKTHEQQFQDGDGDVIFT